MKRGAGDFGTFGEKGAHARIGAARNQIVPAPTISGVRTLAGQDDIIAIAPAQRVRAIAAFDEGAGRGGLTLERDEGVVGG